MANVVMYVALYLMSAPIVGGLLTSADRNIKIKLMGGTAQPLFQPFYDVFILMEQEDAAPNRFSDFFILLSFLFVLTAGSLFFAGESLLLVIFALTSAWVLLTTGLCIADPCCARRDVEARLLRIMAFEPMAMMTAVGFYLHTGSFGVSEIATFGQGSFLPLLGLFAGYVYILTIRPWKADMDLAARASGKSLALAEIGRWYENILLLGIVFLFFAGGTPVWTVAGIVVCLGICFVKAAAGSMLENIKWQFTFGSSWGAAAVLGSVNIAVLCIPDIMDIIFFYIG